MTEPAAVEVVPLTPDLLSTYLAFFEGEAFSDNPAWASCYCQDAHEDHSQIDWNARTAAQNRDLACERIGAGIVRGLLALRDGEPVGWVSAGPRRGYRALAGEPVPDASEVGSIVCFVVAPSARGQGVATALLRAALADFERRGLAIAEAYPRPAAQGTAAHYHGPLSMYEAAGFSVYREQADGSVTVRKALG